MFSTTPVVYRDARGGVLGVFAAARDITGKKSGRGRTGKTPPASGGAGQNSVPASLKKSIFGSRTKSRCANGSPRTLASSNEDLEQFAYAASHDLQEPLRAIGGFVELLKIQLGGALDAKKKEYMDFVVDGVGRMQSLINGLLEYSRIETRGREPVALDSRTALDQALLNLQKEPRRVGARNCRRPLAHGHLRLGAACAALSRTHRHAVKFRSSARRKSASTPSEPEGVAVFVKDNGIGVDPQYATRIFIIFQRLHTRKSYPGTGLGLALCKKIVERHGGRIWVSQTGKRIDLPFHHTRQRRKIDMSSTKFIRPVEILLVEDSPSDAALTVEALEAGKVANRLSHVTDGVEAMAFLRRQGKYADAVRPDLIMLDLNLPKKDGREVLEEMKADPALKTIPVVVLTTSRAESDILRSYQLHANCYIAKPVEFSKFIDVVKSIEHFWLAVVTLPNKADS